MHRGIYREIEYRGIYRGILIKTKALARTLGIEYTALFLFRGIFIK